jgi:hypothetical protein
MIYKSPAIGPDYQTIAKLQMIFDLFLSNIIIFDVIYAVRL